MEFTTLAPEFPFARGENHFPRLIKSTRVSTLRPDLGHVPVPELGFIMGSLHGYEILRCSRHDSLPCKQRAAVFPYFHVNGSI